MTSNDLLTIGSFAMLSGLTIPALPHYNEVGILMPAQVDDWTGYRYYRRDQLPRAQLILALRAVDLPIDEVRDTIDASDADLRAVLKEPPGMPRLAQIKDPSGNDIGLYQA